MSESAERWLAFAYEDLQVAEMVLKAGIYTQACFHSQQCVEKALKGALAHHRPDEVLPRIHAIADLIRLLPAEWFANVRADLIEKMDDYYIPTRYPDALPGTLPEGLPGQAEAEEAVPLARAVLEEVKRIMSLPS
jgi:HEPN domain-containing protein